MRPSFWYSRAVPWMRCGHGQRLVLGGGQIGAGERDVADVAARELELARQEAQVQVVAARHVGRQVLLPQLEAAVVVGHGEVDHRVEPPGEGLVQVGAQVRGQDRDAIEQLHPLEQVRHLDVGVSVVGVLDVGTLAEHRIGLVEQQHAVDPVGLREDAVEVLLRLAHVLVDDRRQVDDIEVEARGRRP